MTFPAAITGEYLIRDFRFGSGEILGELRQCYLTLGEPQYNGHGSIGNAVLLLHNTTGTSNDWVSPGLGDYLFNAGQPLDASRFYIIMPDSIGFGSSSKPSDGLRARFPQYRYTDVVEAQMRLLTEHFRITHLRLILGLSMGGMLTWLWGTMYPKFMDALVPIACQPAAMSGRNWIQRRMAIEAIRNDPGWKRGDYDSQPVHYTLTPIGAIFTQSVVRIQEMASTRETADALYRQMVERAREGDANNRLYQLEASMNYDPTPALDQVVAPVLAINFADDELNPPELGLLEGALSRVRDGRGIVLPATPESRGHYSAQQASCWAQHVAAFMREKITDNNIRANNAIIASVQPIPSP